MKPQFKPEEIYLDLSKLSEEQQRKISVLINGVLNLNSDRFLLSFNPYNQKWELHKYLYHGKELTYSQFLDMMGESKEKSKVIENSEKELINNDGTLYIGEGLENYYKDQLERTGKFKVVAIDATSEEVLQVENYGWIKIESEKDLPKEDISCWWMDKKDGMILGKFLIENNNSDIDFILENATHYQPLIIPEPPKY